MDSAAAARISGWGSAQYMLDGVNKCGNVILIGREWLPFERIGFHREINRATFFARGDPMRPRI